MNGTEKSRPLSLAARLWVAVDRLYPPCANQLVFEGTGSIDTGKWKEAVRKASDANPGSRLVLRGMLKSCKWVVSDVTPGVREVDGSAWDGRGSDDAPFLKSSFSPRNGPNCEVLIIHGNPLRVVFRSHHAIMDGFGTLTWAEDIIRVLRGQEPLGSEYTMTEYDLLKLNKGKRSKPLPHQYIAPTGNADGDSTEMVWKRKTLTGKYPKMVPQLMILTAQEAWRYGEGKVRIGIPVDLRYRKQGVRSTGNLANAIYMDIDKNTTVEKLAEEINTRVAGFIDGEITWEDTAGNYVPVWLLCKGIEIEGSRSQRSGHYRISGLISNGGRLDVDSLSTDDFKINTFFGIPAGASFLPLSMSLVGTKTGTEMLIKMPKSLASMGRLEAAIENIASGLKSIS